MTDLVEGAVHAMAEVLWRQYLKILSHPSGVLDWATATRAHPTFCQGFINQARAALSSVEAAGYRVVPVEPTPEMVNSYSIPGRMRAMWAAALAAAPKVTT